MKSAYQINSFSFYATAEISTTSTLKMVKSLRLVDMNAIDLETMPSIFKKIETKETD